MRTDVAAALLVVALAGCGQALPDGGAAGSSGTGVAPVTAAPAGAGSDLVPEGYDGAFVTEGLVLDEPGVGPQLCVDVVLESNPPQCGGPDLVGWDWDAVPARSYETGSGVRFGTYRLTGTFDGDRLTLTRTAEVQGADGPGGVPGGDGGPAGDGGPVPDGAGAVSPDGRDADALRRLQVELERDQQLRGDVDGFLWAATDLDRAVVVVQVLVAEQAEQDELDAAYGPGAVDLRGLLRPVG
ncbi:hypothetical protein [Aquipuribacter hungaricus]|uniref:Uncharacterized protein n=1 Tax=Aquipuribacter hungaricus TaxID=545624 RepID=A0ABV7WJC4_9MICO